MIEYILTEDVPRWAIGFQNCSYILETNGLLTRYNLNKENYLDYGWKEVDIKEALMKIESQYNGWPNAIISI